MGLHETVRRAYAAEVELWLDEGQLRYRCHGPLPTELKAELSAFKPAITALLVAYGVR